MNVNVDVIFLVKESPSFVIRSLMDKFEKSGISIDKVEMDVVSLESILDMPKFFISDAETLLANTEARVFLYDRCIENNRKLILIGDNSSLVSLYDVTATNVIIESFVRPVNYEVIVENTKMHISEFNAKGEKKNILIIDDSPTYLRLVSEWFEKDYNVNVCPSATAAFHMIENKRPDLILLDYEMPICNGAQFLQMLHSERHTEDIPVIFLTSKDDLETVKSVLALKPQGYLLKNQTKDQTLKTVAEFFVREKLK